MTTRTGTLLDQRNIFARYRKVIPEMTKAIASIAKWDLGSLLLSFQFQLYSMAE